MFPTSSSPPSSLGSLDNSVPSITLIFTLKSGKTNFRHHHRGDDDGNSNVNHRPPHRNYQSNNNHRMRRHLDSTYHSTQTIKTLRYSSILSLQTMATPHTRTCEFPSLAHSTPFRRGHLPGSGPGTGTDIDNFQQILEDSQFSDLDINLDLPYYTPLDENIMKDALALVLSLQETDPSYHH